MSTKDNSATRRKHSKICSQQKKRDSRDSAVKKEDKKYHERKRSQFKKKSVHSSSSLLAEAAHHDLLKSQAAHDALKDKEVECAELRTELEALSGNDVRLPEPPVLGGPLESSTLTNCPPQLVNDTEPGTPCPKLDPFGTDGDIPPLLRTIYWADAPRSLWEGPEFLQAVKLLLSCAKVFFAALMLLFVPANFFMYILKHIVQKALRSTVFKGHQNEIPVSFFNDAVIVMFMFLMGCLLLSSSTQIYALFWVGRILISSSFENLGYLVRFARLDPYVWSVTFGIVIFGSVLIILQAYRYWSWLNKRLSSHTITYRCSIDYCDLLDRRSDSAKMVDLKHQDPLNTSVVYERKWAGFVTYRREFKISLELLAQLAISKNLELGASEGIVFERLKFAASKMGSINCSRWDSLGLDFVSQDTVFVALGLFRNLVWERSHLDFPVPALQ